MRTIRSQTKNKVPVGKTPVPKYTSGDEHREAMRRDAKARRTVREWGYRAGQTKNRVPVGKTPVPKYASWDEHRDAMRRDAKARRTVMEQRRLETVEIRRSLV